MMNCFSSLEKGRIFALLMESSRLRLQSRILGEQKDAQALKWNWSKLALSLDRNRVDKAEPSIRYYASMSFYNYVRSRWLWK